MSVPGLNTITISESPETDSERITSTPSMPFSKSASSGTVIICSTSLAESPNASVWTSTYGGVNSGRTSTGALRSCTIPTAITPTAMAMSNIQNRRLAPMVDRIISENLPAQALSRCHSALKNRGTRLPPRHLLPVGISRVSLLKRRCAAASYTPPTLTGGAQLSHSPRIESEHFQTPKLVGRTPLRVHDARSRKLQWMTYWRMFSSRSFGAESPKNVLLISSSRVGSYLMGTRTLLFRVFRSGIAPVLREAKRADPYRRNTPKEGRSSHVVANDR